MKKPIRKLNGPSTGGSNTAPANRPVHHVVAALILRDAPDSPGSEDAREVFICQRRPDQPMGLKWEFPGGKVEPGETAEAALARELSEELGIDATIGPFLTTVHHTYRNGGAIEIRFYKVTEFAGEMENRIFERMLWSPFARLPDFDFLAADIALVRDLADGKLL